MSTVKKDYYETKLAHRAAGIAGSLGMKMVRTYWGVHRNTNEDVYCITYEMTTAPEVLKKAAHFMKQAFRRAKVHLGTYRQKQGDPNYPCIYFVMRPLRPKKRA